MPSLANRGRPGTIGGNWLGGQCARTGGELASRSHPEGDDRGGVGRRRGAEDSEISLMQQVYEDQAKRPITPQEIAEVAEATTRDGLLAEPTAAAPVLDRETKEEIVRAAYLTLIADHRIAAEERKKLKDIAMALRVPENSLRRHPGRSRAVARGAEGEVSCPPRPRRFRFVIPAKAGIQRKNNSAARKGGPVSWSLGFRLPPE